MKIKEIDTEKGILKISHKETKEDPYKNVRKTFTEGGEYLATVTGFSDNRCICIFKTRDRHNGHTSSVARNTTTLPGDTIIVKVKKIIPEKRKIYSSLIKNCKEGSCK